MHLITMRDQLCYVMADLTKIFISPDIVLQNLEAITACSMHGEMFTYRNFYTQKLLHRASF